MKVFISYSTGDIDLVRKIADQIRPLAEPVYWDKDKEPGREVWSTIFDWIWAADAVLAVITDKTVSRGIAVGEEIGRAKTLGKTIIPLVAQGVPSSELGCLGGVTHIAIDPNDPGKALESLQQKLQTMKDSRDLLMFVCLAAFVALGIALLCKAKGSVPKVGLK